MHNQLFPSCPFCHCLLSPGCNTQGNSHQHQVDGVLEMIKAGLRFAGCQRKGVCTRQDQIAGSRLTEVRYEDTYSGPKVNASPHDKGGI